MQKFSEHKQKTEKKEEEKNELLNQQEEASKEMSGLKNFISEKKQQQK